MRALAAATLLAASCGSAPAEDTASLERSQGIGFTVLHVATDITIGPWPDDTILGPLDTAPSDPSGASLLTPMQTSVPVQPPQGPPNWALPPLCPGTYQPLVSYLVVPWEGQYFLVAKPGPCVTEPTQVGSAIVAEESAAP